MTVGLPPLRRDDRIQREPPQVSARSAARADGRPGPRHHRARPARGIPTIAHTPDAGDGARSPRIAAPERIGGYRLIRDAGAGRHGHGLRGRGVRLRPAGRAQAPPPEIRASPEAVERFRQEGRLASTISPPAMRLRPGRRRGRRPAVHRHGADARRRPCRTWSTAAARSPVERGGRQDPRRDRGPARGAPARA